MRFICSINTNGTLIDRETKFCVESESSVRFSIGAMIFICAKIFHNLCGRLVRILANCYVSSIIFQVGEDLG